MALFAQVGLDPSLLEQGDVEIQYRQMVELFEAAATQLACPDFGMRLAAVQAAQGATKVLGPLEVAMSNSPTLGHAYRYCAEHIHAYSSAAQICFEKLTERFPDFHVVRGAAGGRRAPAAVDRAGAGADSAWDSCDESRSCEGERSVVHPRAAGAARDVSSAFQCDGAIRAEHEWVWCSTSGISTCRCRIRIRSCMRWPTSFIDHRFPSSAMPLRTRVRINIARSLVEGTCTQEHVAAALGLHPRTL